MRALFVQLGLRQAQLQSLVCNHHIVHLDCLNDVVDGTHEDAVVGDATTGDGREVTQHVVNSDLERRREEQSSERLTLGGASLRDDLVLGRILFGAIAVDHARGLPVEQLRERFERRVTRSGAKDPAAVESVERVRHVRLDSHVVRVQVQVRADDVGERLDAAVHTMHELRWANSRWDELLHHLRADGERTGDRNEELPDADRTDVVRVALAQGNAAKRSLRQTKLGRVEPRVRDVVDQHHKAAADGSVDHMPFEGLVHDFLQQRE